MNAGKRAVSPLTKTWYDKSIATSNMGCCFRVLGFRHCETVFPEPRHCRNISAAIQKWQRADSKSKVGSVFWPFDDQFAKADSCLFGLNIAADGLLGKNATVGNIVKACGVLLWHSVSLADADLHVLPLKQIITSWTFWGSISTHVARSLSNGHPHDWVGSWRECSFCWCWC